MPNPPRSTRGPATTAVLVLLALLLVWAHEADPQSGGTVKLKLGGRSTYLVNSGSLTGATSTGVKSLFYIFHGSGIATRYEILAIHVNQIAGSAGSQRIEVQRITAENGTPGCTTPVSVKNDKDDATTSATLCTIPTGAPTREANVAFGSDVPVAINTNMVWPPWNSLGLAEMKPLVVRKSTAEGFEVVQNVITTITTAPKFNITVMWTEQ